MPLVAEWREQRARFKAYWSSVEGLQAEVRVLEVELVLIKERRLTLPPGSAATDSAARNGALDPQAGPLAALVAAADDYWLNRSLVGRLLAGGRVVEWSPYLVKFWIS